MPNATPTSGTILSGGRGEKLEIDVVAPSARNESARVRKHELTAGHRRRDHAGLGLAAPIAVAKVGEAELGDDRAVEAAGVEQHLIALARGTALELPRAV